MTPCFDLDRLRRLLTDEPFGPPETDLAVHVEGCHACQCALEAVLDEGGTPNGLTIVPNTHGGGTGDTRHPARATGAAAASVVLPDSFIGRLCQRLRSADDSGRTVARPVAAAPTRPGVPGYEIVGELGRGGMGVVYKARQVALGRDVALKMILGGHCSSPQVQARLRSEAELVARLTHPNIVQVHEVGEAGGLPFLAMEFVDGGTLAARLKRHPLPPREVASLLATLAAAVHAAHARNVVHRDLKPANVLLTADGVPKIADFGLARGLDTDSRQTISGEVLGTPSFMAPEQAAGSLAGVGPAADIYALGGILYVALTGRPPFAAETPLATLLQVCHQDVVPPSRIRERIPRDLETICLKCLNKAPEERYASALELSDDLNRFLRGEPVMARPVGTAEWIWKWVRRRPTTAALVLLALSTLAGAFVLAGQLWVKEREVRKRTELARDAADIGDQLIDKSLDAEPGQDALQRESLEKILRIYSVLAEDERADPPLRRATARAQFRCGQIYRRLGQFGDAEKAYQGAIRIQEALSLQDTGELVYRQDLANSFNFLGELLRETKRPEEALSWYGRASELQQDLVAASAAPEYRKELARTESNRALALNQLARREDALAGFGRAAELLKPVAAALPNEPTYAQELARVYLNRAVVLLEKGQPAEALKDFQLAIDLQRPLAQRFANPDYRYELAVSLFDQGNTLIASGDRENRAVAAYRESRALLTAVLELNPARLAYARQLARTDNGLGAALCGSDPAGAEDAWRESARRFESLAERKPDLADCHLGASQALGNLGWLLLWRPGPAELASPALGNLAGVLWKRGRTEQARDCLERAVRHLDHPAARGGGDSSTRGTQALVLGNLAEACLRLGDHAAAAGATERFLKTQTASDQECYGAARSYARGLALTEDEACRCRYAARAVELLRIADPKRFSPKADPFFMTDLGSDAAFADLRSRPEFAQVRERWGGGPVAP
ncbi:serine/threonine-protein kinase [Frigoriglobus tundricola]|uniref:non-specific serine/threonine protein kinase n=1 Tax=Frigoriglobus tundricola TaxID=2774151 RepID=A0A6M5Z4Y1_9BACT|nr:serine/threonine-protein kinase [Frigoriglobus tundricola]QJX00847.1 hypothetical protein FTUN_8485 [Frigoriglobus tundricola]